MLDAELRPASRPLHNYRFALSHQLVQQLVHLQQGRYVRERENSDMLNAHNTVLFILVLHNQHTIMHITTGVHFFRVYNANGSFMRIFAPPRAARRSTLHTLTWRCAFWSFSVL